VREVDSFSVALQNYNLRRALYNSIGIVMETKDIDIFLKAKKQQKRIHLAYIISVILVVLFLALKAIDYEHDYIVDTALILSVFIMFLYSKYSSDKYDVTRNELINVIENFINSDAEALEYISNKKN
jgi:hypothetical protein